MNDDILAPILADESAWQELRQWFLWTLREAQFMRGLCSGKTTKRNKYH